MSQDEPRCNRMQFRRCEEANPFLPKKVPMRSRVRPCAPRRKIRWIRQKCRPMAQVFQRHQHPAMEVMHCGPPRWLAIPLQSSQWEKHRSDRDVVHMASTSSDRSAEFCGACWPCIRVVRHAPMWNELPLEFSVFPLLVNASGHVVGRFD